ncbi:MAG: hypothetical protein V1874_10870 [Spirochaetota bacterium]
MKFINFNLIKKILIILSLLVNIISFEELYGETEQDQDANTEKKTNSETGLNADSDKNNNSDATTLPELAVKAQKESATKKTISEFASHS